MRFSPGLARSRETAVILGHSRHSRAVSAVLDVSRSFSVSSRGLVCITDDGPPYLHQHIPCDRRSVSSGPHLWQFAPGATGATVSGNDDRSVHGGDHLSKEAETDVADRNRRSPVSQTSPPAGHSQIHSQSMIGPGVLMVASIMVLVFVHFMTRRRALALR
jgi:hypothetical protein